MNRELLEKIFADPPSAEGITWDDIKTLLEDVVRNQGSVSSGPGARTRVELNGRKAIFPYPQVPNVGMILRTRRFLKEVGVLPWRR